MNEELESAQEERERSAERFEEEGSIAYKAFGGNLGEYCIYRNN